MVLLEHLEEQQRKDLELLKELENKHRYEDNPRLKLKLEAEITEIKQNIQNRQQEIESIKLNGTKVTNPIAIPYPKGIQHKNQIINGKQKRKLQTAIAKGWVEDLVRAAYNSNPKNTILKAIAEKLIPDCAVQNQYYEWLIYKCQNYRTEGLSQIGSLFLSNVFVPLKVAASYKDKACPEMIPLKYSERDLQTIWDFLVAASGKTPKLTQRSIVILGAPGAGKTTLLKYLSFVYANKEQKKYELETLFFKFANEEQKNSYQRNQYLIPIFLLIREVCQEIIKKQPRLADLIAKEVKLTREKNQNSQVLSEWFTQQLEQNKCLVMLDGLDEVADESQRKLVSGWLDQQIENYRGNIFILTSRPGGYKNASLNNAGIVLEVQPFNLEQICSFIDKWYLETEKIRLFEYKISDIEKQAKDLINRIRNSSSLAAMAVNPLLLIMIATVHHKLSLDNKKLPEKRFELYKEMCEVLLEKRQDEKNIPNTLISNGKQSVLQVLALGLMQNQITGASLYEAIERIKATGILSEVKIIEDFLKYICEFTGLLVEREVGFYEFAHLSFQEYLASVQLNKLGFQSPKIIQNLIIKNLNNPWWAETIRLYAAQSKGNVNYVISQVLNIKSPSIEIMVLAYDCFKENENLVEPHFRQELVRKLEEGLESHDEEIFSLAVQVRLWRRLNKLQRIDEKEAIDNSYITCAEYQLFLNKINESLQPQHWRTNRFPYGNATQTITGISRENANKFCFWLKEWSEEQKINSGLTDEVNFYRLANEDEIKKYSGDDQRFTETGICLFKFQLPSKYSQLAYYLMNGEWQEADVETAWIMLKFMIDRKGIRGGWFSFPCEDLRIVDQLWVYASKGKWGFSVQKSIYQKNQKKDYDWVFYVKEIVKWDKIYYKKEDLSPRGHLPKIPYLLEDSGNGLRLRSLVERSLLEVREGIDINIKSNFVKEVILMIIDGRYRSNDKGDLVKDDRLKLGWRYEYMIYSEELAKRLISCDGL